MTTTTTKGFLAAFFLTVLLSAAPAWAGHVVWVDFGNFHLNCWDSVNGNDPPKPTDREAIKKLVLANMTEDYATFDVTFTTVKPANGRYTRVRIYGLDAEDDDGNTLFGCAGGDCCKQGNCSGGDSWTKAESSCEVYSGSFSGYGEFTGSNATTFRIANGISHTASHELGHVLGLSHCNAADDSITLGCSGITSNTNDQNARWHIMASGASWDLSMDERATRDRFFSVHSERRKLASAVQLRNHFAPLANVNGGSGPYADLTYGYLAAPAVMKWWVRLSSGSGFGGWSEWSSDAGGAGDLYYTGDVDDDGKADLVYGRIESPTQIIWYVRKSTGSGFGGATEWIADGGDVGDIIRLADVNQDGMADLVFGRPLDASTVRWYVRKSDGDSFGNAEEWATDAGNVGDLFFLADVDHDDRADLVYSRAISSKQVKWWVRRSDGEKFGPLQTWSNDAGDRGDLMYVGDVTGEGDADLVYGRVNSSFGVTWYFRPGDGSKFGSVDTWANDGGDAGDLFRLGDATGDGKLDLVYGRPLGMTPLSATPDLTLIRWYGRAAEKDAFGSVSTWSSNAGDEGELFP